MERGKEGGMERGREEWKEGRKGGRNGEREGGREEEGLRLHCKITLFTQLTWMLQDGGINGTMLMQERKRENSTIQVVAQPSSFNKLDPFLSIVPIASSIVCAGY